MLRLRPFDVTVYHFNADGLNEGLERWDPDYVDDILHPMSTCNMWNVCQRFYCLLRCHTHDIDKRLLQPIYAVVHGDMVVGGPYPNRKLAEADCDTGDEVLEILHTDQGYGEFKAFMK